MQNCQSVVPARQQGSVLIISLLLLVILTVLGISAMTTSTLEERMAGGTIDQNIAFQAAENALRDAEVYANTLSRSGFSDNCDNGLCNPSTTATNVWDSNTWTGNTSILYGANTGAAAIAGVALQPRYIIELLPDKALAGESLDYGKAVYGIPYRITAIGWGRQAGTLVMLQSVYVKL